MGSPVLFTSLKRRVHLLMALLVVGVASFVILGWILRNPFMIQIRPDFAPMVFNSALSFLLLGIGFLFSEGRQQRYSHLSSLLVFIISFLTLIQYLGGINLGIDSLVFTPFYKVGVTYPGRMAISTTVCFLLLSLAGLLQGSSYAKRMIKITAAALVLGFSLIGLFGYILNFSSEYGWGNWSRMAIHTSVCFLLLSVANIWQLRRVVRSEEPGRAATVPIYVVTIGTLMAVLIWQVLLLKDIEKNRSITQIRAEGFKSKLDGTFLPLEKALLQMARRMAVGSYKSESIWQLDAKFYHEEFQGIRRLTWSDSAQLIRWVYPEDDFSRGIRNTMIGKAPEVFKELEEARTTNQTRISKVFDFRSGGKGFAILVPVYRGSKYLGVVTAAIDLPTFVDRFAKEEGYHIAVLQDDIEVYRSADWDPVLSRDWVSKVRYDNLSVKWEIAFSPSTGAIRNNSSSIPGVVLVFGVSISVLLGLALSFYNRANELGRRARAVAKWKSAAMDATPLMMISLDENCIIREMNSSAESLTGWKSEELAGKAIPTVFHDHQDVELFRLKMEGETGRKLDVGVDLVEAMFERGYHTASEWTYVRRDGYRFLGTLSLGRVLDEQGLVSGYLAVVEDVTQKREKERQLKEQEDRIITSSRLASLGEMAAGIAHEINNPLAIINGHLGVLRRLLSMRGLSGDLEVQKRVEVVETTVHRIAKIVKGLRTYSRESDQGEKEWVRVDTIVEDTLAFCSDKFRNEGVELIARVEPQIQVLVRPYQISQVLLNLLNNALDAVQVVSSGRRVEVEARAAQTGVEIMVTDNGPGVSPFIRDKIMEPFFTTKEVGKGVGLGLSISEGIIRSHDGRFYLDEQSKQTRFVIWLPQQEKV